MAFFNIILCRHFSLIAVSRCYPSCSALTSHCSSYSCCGAWALGHRLQWLRFPGSSICSYHSSVAVAHGLSCSVACGDFLTRDRTHVSCISRPVLYHWTTSKAWSMSLNFFQPHPLFFSSIWNSQHLTKVLSLIFMVEKLPWIAL